MAPMDRNLFSRGSTPPISPNYQQGNKNNTPSTIDSLFQSISAPSTDRIENSFEALVDQPATDRQTGLLFPIGNTTRQPQQSQPPQLQSQSQSQPQPQPQQPQPQPQQSQQQSQQPSQPQPQLQPQPQPQPQLQQPPQLQPSQSSQPQPSQPQPSSQPQPQQVPTPPGSSQRSNASPPQSDTQQKLLEQLMSGSSSRPTKYSEPQRANPQPQPGPSPPYSQREEYRNYSQHDQASEASPRLQAVQHSHLTQPQQQQQQQQQQQPSSPRRSIFEFTSAFDHMPVKKKPVPAAQPASVASSTDDSTSWTTVPDPKRQSVENLLENLTRGQPPSTQAHTVYESYLSGSDFSSSAEPVSTRAPLPPIPMTKTLPHRGPSPPKTQHVHRPQARAPDLSVNSHSPHSQSPQSTHGTPTRRDKESSPGPRSNAQRPQKTTAKFNKSQSSPSPQAQSIVFDVSQSLDEVQARESVKSTAIALVKQDSVFLPGTTIGATHWVAYAMTKGRVRIISRSSGDRTLLQLPQAFFLSSSIIDMAVYGNRLAGVTSDGGFIVWELPEVITDDVPGHILLCIPPTGPEDAIRAVKWYPKDPDVLAIASDKNIYVIDLANTHALHGQPLPHSDLHHIGQIFNVSSTIVAFDFDVAHYAIATLSEDSTLTIWNMHDRLPYLVQTIHGDDTPSSLTFVDGGFVVGRKNGTVFQLLSMSTKTLLSTIKFINSATPDDIDMFGHINYDSRIQTLWVANCRRDSLIALKVNIDEDINRGHIEQVVEFSGIKPTIHFVILTGDADPHGTEANAACVAAKVPPGELALVAFSVHSSGVDQILIRKEWFDMALAQTESKFPAYDLPQNVTFENKALQQQQRQVLPAVPVTQSLPQPAVSFAPPPQPHTPPSDDFDNEYAEGRSVEQKFKGNKGKVVGWKEKEELVKEKEKKATDASIISDSNLGQALSREIKKTEESLHSRIGRLIGREMDKQQSMETDQRFEEARLHEQAEDFSRQEKILKLISTELTRNTTRVVEMAVKNEIQHSVLPSLENITKNEVKGALSDQIGISLIDVINRSLPVEMEKLLLRPTISNHFANILSTALTPSIERHIKEVLTTSVFQFHSQQTAAMHQDLLRELRSEISNIKSELGTWHSESMRSQEATIRDLEHTVRALSDQVKFLSINSSSSHSSSLHHPQQQQQNSPGAQAPPLQTNIAPSHLRQTNIAPPAANVPTYTQAHTSFQAPPTQPPLHQQWYSGIAAPQASHPATIPQPPPAPQAQSERSPVKSDQWDEIYLGVLHSQDPTKLRDLLSRTNPDIVLPLNGTPLVSQAVILTLVHRLSAVVGDTAPNDDLFKTSLWWLQRVAGLLRPEDKLIADFIPRVIPTVQQSLNTTKQRLAILPGGSATMETARALSDVQDALRRKVAS